MTPRTSRPYYGPERRHTDGTETPADRFDRIEAAMLAGEERNAVEHQALQTAQAQTTQQLSRLWGGLVVIAAEVPLVLALFEWLLRGR